MYQPEGSGRLAAYLARELGAGYRVIAPEMPDADDPHYQPWRDRIEQELEARRSSGHSGWSLVRRLGAAEVLAEGSHQKPVRGLFLVSVHDRGPDGWAYEEFAVPDDVGLRLPTSRIFLYHSRDDPEVPFVHLGYYHKRLPAATVRAIDGSEHSFLQGLPTLVDDIKTLPR